MDEVKYTFETLAQGGLPVGVAAYLLLRIARELNALTRAVERICACDAYRIKFRREARSNEGRD